MTEVELLRSALGILMTKSGLNRLNIARLALEDFSAKMELATEVNVPLDQVTFHVSRRTTLAVPTTGDLIRAVGKSVNEDKDATDIIRELTRIKRRL